MLVTKILVAQMRNPERSLFIKLPIVFVAEEEEVDEDEEPAPRADRAEEEALETELINVEEEERRSNSTG